MANPDAESTTRPAFPGRTPDPHKKPLKERIPAVLAEWNRKRPLLFSLLILLAAACGIFFFSCLRSTRRFSYRDFSSLYFEQEERKETSGGEEISGIFAYGPYFSLEKGDWEGTIYYDCDRSNTWELTSGYGVDRLASGQLRPETDHLTFLFHLEEGVSDNSLELRLWYDQGGALRLDRFSLRRQSFLSRPSLSCLLMMAAFLMTTVICQAALPAAAFLCGLFYLLLGEAAVSSFAGGILSFLLLMLLFLACRKHLSPSRLRELLLGGECLRLGAAAFLSAASLPLFANPGNIRQAAASSVAGIGLFRWFVLILMLLLLIRLQSDSAIIPDLFLFSGALLFAMACVRALRLSGNASEETLPLTAGILLLLTMLTFSLASRHEKSLEQLLQSVKSYRIPFAVTLAAAVCCTLFYAWETICRHRIFGGSCFDMGIFAQMFEYMANTGLPLTTCERGELLSHFAIHFSPIFYLLLPVYLLFRTPETLLVLQAAFACFACIPLFLLCRHLKLKPLATGILSVTWLTIPAVVQPLFYDFHENTFLPFFLFWFLYFFLEKKNRRAFLFLLLTLMVKEEAAVYVMVLELFILLSLPDKRRSLTAFAFTVFCFAAIMIYISTTGRGLMEGHYGIYYRTGESGLLAMAANILHNPGFFLKNVFDGDNIPYIIYTLGALLFLPLTGKDPRRLLLLVPYVAFGLMTDYAYQHDIGYQYTYGSMVLLLYAFLLNLRELPKKFRISIPVLCLAASLMLSYTYRGDGFFSYSKSYRKDQASWDAKEKFLRSMPSGISATVDTFLLPHVAFIEELYLYENEKAEEIHTEYVILSAQGSYDFLSCFDSLGYQLYRSEAGINVYHLEGS